MRWILEAFLRVMTPGARQKLLLRLFNSCGARVISGATKDQNDSVKEQEQRILAEFANFLKLAHAENPPARIDCLKLLLSLDNGLYQLISSYALESENGLHPKHRLIGYHDFFCLNIQPDETVLDIGCGNGFLTNDMAKCTRGRVLGIDMNHRNIEYAKAHYQSENLQFILGDATRDVVDSRFDVVVMSNVLEHVSERVKFLTRLHEAVRPMKLLVRVPMYEREWMVPLKEELGIEYRLDATHCIEHTQEQLFGELKAAGFEPEHSEFRWGEIWCRCIPIRPGAKCRQNMQ